MQRSQAMQRSDATISITAATNRPASGRVQIASSPRSAADGAARDPAPGSRPACASRGSPCGPARRDDIHRPCATIAAASRALKTSSPAAPRPALTADHVSCNDFRGGRESVAVRGDSSIRRATPAVATSATTSRCPRSTVPVGRIPAPPTETQTRHRFVVASDREVCGTPVRPSCPTTPPPSARVAAAAGETTADQLHAVAVSPAA